MAHVGDLDSYFDNNEKIKKTFLDELYNLLDDDLSRYLVPEVNSSNDDFLSIISDLIDSGFEFE